MSRFSEHERCEHCRFSRPPEEDFSPMSCHRYPPSFYVLEDSRECDFPYVRDDDWCGEFQWQKDAWNAVSAIVAEDMKKEKP